MPESRLKNKAIELLQKDKGSWPDTAKNTGLNYDWISKLSQGEISDPGASKLETLIDYLEKKFSGNSSVHL